MPSMPSYKKPPVIEVVSGVVFERLQSLKVPYWGFIWEKFRADFPKCEHAPPMASEENPLEEFSGDFISLVPRLWFINQGEDRLIQLQSNRYYYNWRSRPQKETYPRFSDIYPAFEKYWGVFSDFVREYNLGELVPKAFELSYINHIPKGQGWETPSDIGVVVPDFAWAPRQDRFLPPPKGLAWQANFELPDDNGILRVKLQQALREPDKVPLMVLELSAKGLGKDKSLTGIKQWFELAHMYIVRGFADLTSVTTQTKIWEREDVGSN